MLEPEKIKQKIISEVSLLKNYIAKIKELHGKSIELSEREELNEILLKLNKIKKNYNEIIFILFNNSLPKSLRDTNEVKKIVKENEKLKKDLIQLKFSSYLKISVKLPENQKNSSTEISPQERKFSIREIIDLSIDKLMKEQQSSSLEYPKILNKIDINDQEILEELKEIANESTEKFTQRNKRILDQEASFLSSQKNILLSSIDSNLEMKKEDRSNNNSVFEIQKYSKRRKLC